jgi:hypothetical protein
VEFERPSQSIGDQVASEVAMLGMLSHGEKAQ